MPNQLEPPNLLRGLNVKDLSKKDLITIIDQSSEELHQKIDNHRFLMASILEENVGDMVLKRVARPFPSSREKRLKDALKETIEILEQTRKAFKSKRLEVLRRKLTHVLVDAE